MNKARTGDQYLVKKINKSIVLNTIQQCSPISRAQIAKDTNLNKATVSTMVTELLNESLVYEIGQGQSSGGRKPVMLYFNNKAGYSIGIDLGVNYILAILTDLRGEIIEEYTETLHSREFHTVLQSILHLIEKLILEAPASPYGIVGIGLGIPGFVDTKGQILQASGLEWKHVDLIPYIEDKFNIPITIENEANAGALGEKIYGLGNKATNLIYISIGMGIGTGIIINNNLYKGSTGIAAEMGHMTIELKGKKCFCGNRGCWELYASEYALIEEAQKLKGFKNTTVTLEKLLEEAYNGNKEIINLFHHIGEYLGIGITNIINTLNPEIIIIGNRMGRFEKWITNSLERVLDERLSPHHREATQIIFSNLDHYSIALGSSFLAISNFFLPHTIEVK
ncbi:ROK family transcriptional regulator [Bacillus massiliigorillae]|uniref:ROK family transcriptional regulator n=1 Tax=Bacillus massiliigorillae TaxID=1243664 RepID=UPI0003A8F7F1|nr:ROK family transcriptional regulator [Bacillus massiliigorillae]